MAIKVNVRDRIPKPVNEVFAAFIEPEKMAHYFISGASGPMKPGARVVWEFADVGATVPIDVIEVEDERKIVYESSALGPTLRTTIQFTSDDPGMTVVTINEASFPLDEDGVKLALGQNAGWTYTLCCLKAYLQFGINLRAGLDKRITDV